MNAVTRIRALIVDDEPLARDSMRLLLEKDDEVVIVEECQNGLGAVRCLRNRPVDLVFLDVQMPELDGFGVIEEIGADAMPVVVFVTAHDEYALQAFESHALDYLLKPFDDERFLRALDRAKKRIQQRAAARLTAQMAALLADHHAGPGATRSGATETPDESTGRLAFKESGRLIFLEPREIQWVEAADYCVRIHTANGPHLIRETMDAMERTLMGQRFMRVHRSSIVNLTCVREVRRSASGESSVILNDGTIVKLSRTRRRQVERRLQKL